MVDVTDGKRLNGKDGIGLPIFDSVAAADDGDAGGGGGGKCFVFSQRMGFPLPAAKEWENSTGGVWWAVDWCWL